MVDSVYYLICLFLVIWRRLQTQQKLNQLEKYLIIYCSSQTGEARGAIGLLLVSYGEVCSKL